MTGRRVVAEEALRSEPGRWLRVGEVVLDLEGLVVHVGEGRVSLTYREFLVLRALMVRAGQVVSRAEILEAAWGDRRPRTRMVDVYVRRVRSRLGDRVTGQGPQQTDSLELHIQAVRGRGYVFADPGSVDAAGQVVDVDDTIPAPRPSTDAHGGRVGGPRT